MLNFVPVLRSSASKALSGGRLGILGAGPPYSMENRPMMSIALHTLTGLLYQGNCT